MIRFLAPALALVAALLPGITAAHPADSYETVALVTYYMLDGQMADGALVHYGAAACNDAIPAGATILFAGEEFTCEDEFAPQYQHDTSVARVDIWGRPDLAGCEMGCRITVLY